MTNAKRPRKESARSSDPKICALGWDELPPESLIDKTIEHFRKATDAAKKLADESPIPTPDAIPSR